ncbi:hypothetical protein PC120_g21452 [Phytophthora cactorum]|nr:hypothetical protein PC120_g21452 [Phytophthora cactorum]
MQGWRRKTENKAALANAVAETTKVGTCSPAGGIASCWASAATAIAIATVTATAAATAVAAGG